MDLKKTQLFNSGGVLKRAYFQKKWTIPLINFHHNIYITYCYKLNMFMLLLILFFD